MRLGSVALTYRQGLERLSAAAGGLASAGVRPGDRVALMCSNRIELVDAFFGCLWLGAIAVPLNTALRGGQLRHALDNSGASRLLIESHLAGEALAHVERPESLVEVWSLDGLPREIPRGYRIVEPPPPGEQLPLRDVPPGETAAIMYTSGTTGPSKGVQAPQAQLYWWGVMMSHGIRTRPDDVLYNCLPLFHGNALMAPLQALVMGASCALGERFSASRFWMNAAENGATVSFLLGALANRLLAQPPAETDRAHSVRAILAPGMPAALWEPFCERFGVEEIVECYGMIETNHCIGRTPQHPHSRPGRMGYVFDEYFEAQVVDEHDRPVPDGTPGELVMRNRFPFSFSTGYWGMPEKTVEAFGNLWFHSGDRAVREPDGCFRFVDRSKDSMRRLGENISSWEVEEAILTHELVAEVAVFPIRSEETDEEVMAAIVPVTGATIDPAQLIEHLQPRLARFALPRYVEFVAELPHTANGKIQKEQLRARGVTEACWDRFAPASPAERISTIGGRR